MDERDGLATSFGDMCRAMIPAFVWTSLPPSTAGTSPDDQIATLYALDALARRCPSAASGPVGRSVSATSRLVDRWCGAVWPNAGEHPADRRVRRIAPADDGDALCAVSSASGPRPSSKSWPTSTPRTGTWWSAP